MWRRHVRTTANWFAVGLLATTAWLLLSQYIEQHRSELLDHGDRTTATVTGGESGWRWSNDYIDVVYRVGGKRIHGTLTGASPDEHRTGSDILIYVDPDHPARFRTSEVSNAPGTLLAFEGVTGLVALTSLIFGVSRALAAARWRRWLGQHGTRRGTATARVVKSMFGTNRQIVRIRIPHAQIDVITLHTGLRRWTMLRDLSEDAVVAGSVTVCAGAWTRVVVFDPDVKVPIELQLPLTRRTADRWALRFRQAGDN